MTKNYSTKNESNNDSQLSTLLLKAKGPPRTGIEFCKECGISASTYSRYVNLHNKRPCPIEMLQKIAAHADPASKVTLNQLLSANGSTGEEYTNHAWITRNELIGLLTSALINKNCYISFPDQRHCVKVLGLSYSPTWSMAINDNRGQKTRQWDFFLYDQLEDLKSDSSRFIRQFLIIAGAQQLGCLSVDQLTFVFTNELLYDHICRMTGQIKPAFAVSYLYIDPVKKTILKEHLLDGCESAPYSILPSESPCSPEENTLLSADKDNLM